MNIHAETHSDDNNVEVKFDATSWFKQANDEDIRELIAIGFGGDIASDEIARFYEKTTTKRLFAYLATDPTMDGDTVGFECHVNADDAYAWLTKNRPHLLKRPYAFTVSGTVDLQHGMIPERGADGTITGVILENGDILKLVVGFEIQRNTDGAIAYACGDDEDFKNLGIENVEYNETSFKKSA